MSALPANRMVSTDVDAFATRCAGDVAGSNSTVLRQIFESEINLAIWHRCLSIGFRRLIAEYVSERPALDIELICHPADGSRQIGNELGPTYFEPLAEDIAALVEMFCSLLGVPQALVRMTVLRHSMCPKFHVDQVPCRLITSYQGVGTQWLANKNVNRDKLGAGSAGKLDRESGVYEKERDIQKIAIGDVALLKGEAWQGNQNAGLVHRSPALPAGEKRLLLTIDYTPDDPGKR